MVHQHLSDARTGSPVRVAAPGLPQSSRPRLLLAGVLALAMLLVGVLAVGLPSVAGAQSSKQAASKSSTAGKGAAPTSVAGVSDGGTGQGAPDIQGGPDSYGYTYIDNRDNGGPAYNWREGSTRIPDNAWVQTNPIQGSTPLDDGVYTTTLPFAFTLYGTTYPAGYAVHISTNGNIHFGEPNDYVPNMTAGPVQCLPSTSQYAPKAMIAPFWYDFSITGTAGIYLGSEGVAPNRNYIVEWRNVANPFNTDVRATFELVLSENGDITYQYANFVDPSGYYGVYGSRGLIGIQNADGTVGLPYGTCGQDVLAPNRAVLYRVARTAYLQPSTSTSQGAAAGTTLTYTAALRNQTGVTNSFVFTHTGNTWPTDVTPQNSGPVPNGGTVPVTVTVQIPQGESIGARDVVTVSASSTLPAPGAYTATMVLTSSVTSSGIDFTPANPTKAGDFGSTVTYPLRVYNRTGQTNTIQLTASSTNWPTTLSSITIGPLSDGASAPLTVTVQVPANATLGMLDVLRIDAEAQQPSPGTYYGQEVITTTAGVWRIQNDMPQPRSRSATVSYGNGLIYLLGGEGSFGGPMLPIEVYDSASSIWYARANLAVPVMNAGAAAIGDRIYVVGGYSDSGVQSALQSYDPAADQVTVVQTDPLPEARFGAGVAAVGGKLYVMGGADSAQVPKATVFEYDPGRPAGSRWQAKSPMPTARVYLGAAAVDGIIYAVGGVSRVVQPVDLTTVEAYDPSTDTWTTKAPLSVGRGGVAVVGVNSSDPGCGARLYALGGGYNDPLASAEIYDPSSNTWRPLSAMQINRRTAAAAYSPLTQSVLVFGGWASSVKRAIESITCTTGVSYCSTGFFDVAPGSTFYPYTRCLGCQGVLGGYPDRTFRPSNNVTRGQLAKIVSNAAGYEDAHTTQTYADVPTSDNFYIWIERLSARNIINGYPCGGPGEPCDSAHRPYFRPYTNSSRGQISKIVAGAKGVTDPVPGTQQTYTDVLPGSPFWLYIERLTARGVMSGYNCGGPGEPCDAQHRPYFRPGSQATRGQIAKIVSNTFFPDCSTSLETGAPGRQDAKDAPR